IAVAGHNIKIGRGGIREIEFFVQTQQLIAGGRHPELRIRQTLATLDALTVSGWISATARDELGEAYRFLRGVEHRLQMVADEQTHTFPSDPAALDQLAHFAGYDGREAFETAILAQLRKVQHHYARLFEDAPKSDKRANLAFPEKTDDRETLDWLSTHGFKKPLETSALVRSWLAGGYPALKSAFAREQFSECLPLLIEQFARL